MSAARIVPVRFLSIPAALAAALACLVLVAGPAVALDDTGPAPGAGRGGCCAKQAGGGGGCGPGGGGGGCCGKRAGRGPGRGMGPGAGRGHGGMRGNADGHHEVIQGLLADHDRITRTVEHIDDGVITVTTSDDPEVAHAIRRHVRQMAARMESGQGVRHWDPLFVELFRHHEAVSMELEDVPGGIRVHERSDDPEVRKLIRQHADRGVSEFVARGHERAPHPTPLPEDYRAEGAAD